MLKYTTEEEHHSALTNVAHEILFSVFFMVKALPSIIV